MRNLSSLPDTNYFPQLYTLVAITWKHLTPCVSRATMPLWISAWTRRSALPKRYLLQHKSVKERRKTGKKERLFQSKSGRCWLTVTGTQPVAAGWCPAVPPLRPHPINYTSTCTALAPWTKQQRHHATAHSLKLSCGRGSAGVLLQTF